MIHLLIFVFLFLPEISKAYQVLSDPDKRRYLIDPIMFWSRLFDFWVQPV